MMRLIAILLLLAAPTAARAQLYSYADWTFGTSLIVLRVSLPDAAAAAIAGPGIPALTDAALSAYVAAHVGVHAGGTVCPPMDQGEDVGLIDTLAAAPGLHRYEVMFLCPAALAGAAVSLTDRVLLDRVPGHVGFARIVPGRGHAVLRQTDAAHPTITVPASGSLAGTGLLGYAGIGWAQLVGSASRLACLAALLLAVRRRQDAMGAAAGLVAGFALSLAIAASGVWAIRSDACETMLGLLSVLLAWRAIAPAPPRRVAAGIAAAILLLAAREIAIGHTDDALLLLAQACLAPAVLLTRGGPAAPLGLIAPSALFGLLNGAAFAAAIAGVGLPAAATTLPLAGHALGALLACAIVGVLGAAVRRIARPGMFGRALAFDLAAASLVGFGVFWFASRLHA